MNEIVQRQIDTGYDPHVFQGVRGVQLSLAHHAPVAVHILIGGIDAAVDLHGDEGQAGLGQRCAGGPHKRGKTFAIGVAAQLKTVRLSLAP